VTAAALMILVFRIDEVRCGLAASGVREVLPALAVRPLPGQAPFIAGTIDVRGTPVPVIDLRVRFGRPARAMRLSDRLIVAQAHARPLALWVDDVEDFIATPPGEWIVSGGLVAGDRSLVGVGSTAAGLTAIHDLEAFVSECESDALAQALAS
jgi:purine-binding chemotaxis protein CheW